MHKKIIRLYYDSNIKDFLLGEFINTGHKFSNGTVVWARVLVWDITDESVVYFQTKRSTFGDMVMMPISKEDANYE